MPVCQLPLLLALLLAAIAPFAIYWFVQPLNYESIWLERFLAFGGSFLLMIALLTMMLC
jgi:hypothetical protein